MAASETPFQGPRACPFVALELDRDRRSERPDYRHRCFAEPTPAPRSIAHQEAYCLSPSFAACPIFQDWAVRAAAAPVGTPLSEMPAAAAVIGAPAAAASDEPPIGEPPLVAPPPVEAQSVTEPAAWDDEARAEQLSVFDAPPPSAAADLPDEPRSSYGEPDAGYVEPPDLPLPDTPTDYVPPPPRRETYTAPAADEEPDVPPFLAGRPPRPAASQAVSSPLPPPRPSERISRDELVPSWDIDGRFGAEPAHDPGGGGRLDNVLTAIAVVAILLLGVAGVVFLPGMLAGTPSRTPSPSLQSARPSVQPTAAFSLAPTVPPQTAAPTVAPSVVATPQVSPRFYRIKPGDSLARIARRFDITVDELLAANPDIENPNHIEVGQVIVIPPPSGGG